MIRGFSRSAVAITVVLAVGAVIAAGIVALVILLSASVPQPRMSSMPSPVTASKSYDPYPVYFVRLSLELPGTAHLTRADAQARAFLGCGVTFAPGTVDSILADAYRPAGTCN